MTVIPSESELKLAIEPAHARAIAACGLLASLSPRRVRLVATYFDTPTGELAAAGLALRLRREGRHWRATLKAEGDGAGGLHRRPEWEYAMPGPVLALERFAHTPLSNLPEAGTLHERLAPILSTDISRTGWVVEPGPGSRVEVVLDIGRLAARGREVPVHEVEIEILEGPLAAAFDVAEALAASAALRPDPESKLARGLRLAARARRRPQRAAQVTLDDSLAPGNAAGQVVLACLAQLQANESGALESADVEFVHQMRVAIRRLRSALRLFAPAFAPGALDALTAEVRWAGAVLGEVRDWDVFVTQSLPPLVAAHGDAELAREMLRRARAQQRAARKAARDAIRSARYGIAMIRLLRWALTQAPETAAPGPLVEFASGRLRKGHKRVRAGAAAFASLDAAKRHRLRLAVKRQRYAAEFLGALFRAPRVRRHLRRLADAQEALGAANDGANALAHLQRLDPPQGLREFARGWFAARDADGLPRAAATLDRAARQKRFWARPPPAIEPGAGP